MNTFLLIVALVSSLASCFVSCFHAWLDYKKSKERDVIWDSALKMICAKDCPDVDEFAEVYAELKFAKENPYAVIGFNTIREAMNTKLRTEESQQTR